MLTTILKSDRSLITRASTSHLILLNETVRLDVFMNASKVERLLRILINANFPFYGESYSVSFDDTMPKIMLLQFAGVEVTDYDKVHERSIIYENSLSDNLLNRLPMQFATIAEAVRFAKDILMNHNAKKLSFLCKLHIRKYLGPCQNSNILKDRVEMLPLPKNMQRFLASSLI